MTSLENLSQQFIPDQWQAMEKEYKHRLEPLETEYKNRNWSDTENFVATKMAKARFDVEWIYAVFQEIYRRRLQ